MAGADESFQGAFAEAPAQESRSSSPVSLGTVTNALRKSWWVILVFTALLTLGMAFFTLGQTKIYRSNATVQLDPQPLKPLGRDVQMVDYGVGSYWSNQEYYETQYQVIQSRKLSETVVRQLSLHRDAAFLANAPSTAELPEREVPVDRAANVLRSRLSVEPVEKSRLVRLTYESADPDRAKRVLQALVAAYLEQNLDNLSESATSASDWLRSQLGALNTNLKSSEMALHQFKRKNNILSVSFDDQSNMLRDELKDLNAALTNSRTRRESVAARYRELSRVPEDDPSSLPASELLESATLSKLRSEYVNAKLSHQSLVAQGKGPEHPDVRAAASKVEISRSALLDEVKNIKAARKRDLRALNSEISGLSGLAAAAKTRALELNRMEIDYNRLNRTYTNNEKLYSLVLERSKESDLTRMLRFNNIRVVDDATQPTKPVRPSVPINVALGFIAGLTLGLGVALGRELLDRTIKTQEDLEERLGLAFMGMLPMGTSIAATRPQYSSRRSRKDDSTTSKPELIVHEKPTSTVAEAARTIRSNLLFMSPDKPHRVLLVTSAAPRDGKTTLACSVAIAMAQAGQRVLLIDCDMRRPRLHRVFDVSNRKGLTTMLVGDNDSESAIHDVLPQLWLLPCGPIPPNPAELLHSERFAQRLQQLSSAYDRIVIDSPPVVPVTDAAILSTQVDATLLVTRASVTTRDLAQRAVRALRDVGGNLVGAVLNDVDLTRGSYGSQSYYYYYRHRYGEDAAVDEN